MGAKHTPMNHMNDDKKTKIKSLLELIAAGETTADNGQKMVISRFGLKAIAARALEILNEQEPTR